MTAQGTSRAYTQLFDWKLEDMQMEGGAYTMINVGEGTGDGLMKHPMPGAPSTWLLYVLVDDIDAATKKVKALCGTVMKDKTEAKDMGSGSRSSSIRPARCCQRDEYVSNSSVYCESVGISSACAATASLVVPAAADRAM